MTNKDRLISLLGFAPANDNSVDGALLDFGIDGNVEYVAVNGNQVKKAAIQVMEMLLTTPDTTTESGTTFIQKYDRAAVQARIKLLKGELGLTDESLPYITSRSVW